MFAVHGIRHARLGIGASVGPPPVCATRSINVQRSPCSNDHGTPSLVHLLFSRTRSLSSHFLNHLAVSRITRVPVPRPPSRSLLRPTYHHSSAQSIRAGFSLPVRHFLSDPKFSSPRLPRGFSFPANVTHVGLGTARTFHSGRPVFQDVIENVPMSVRALSEAEWEREAKRKEARKLCRAKEDFVPLPKLQDKLKPRSRSLTWKVKNGGGGGGGGVTEPVELDSYFPLGASPAVTTYLFVPLAPTPTARLPLSSRAVDDTRTPLLLVPELMSTHYDHRLHSLRVSTLFARLDTGSVWDDPSVGCDAYAGRTRQDAGTHGELCTILRVSFPGWDVNCVRAVVGDSVDDWCTLEEIRLPTASARSASRMESITLKPALRTASHEPCVAERDFDDDDASDSEPPDHDLGKSLPVTATASVHHELVFPVLDFSSSFSEAMGTTALQSPLNSPRRPSSRLADYTESDGWSIGSPVSSPSVLSLS